MTKPTGIHGGSKRKTFHQTQKHRKENTKNLKDINLPYF
jgi:hypothetical protein